MYQETGTIEKTKASDEIIQHWHSHFEKSSKCLRETQKMWFEYFLADIWFKNKDVKERKSMLFFLIHVA